MSQSFWSQAETTFESIFDVIDPMTKSAIQQGELSTVSGHWYHLVQALNILPEGLTVARMTFRSPYTSAKRHSESLQILAARGFLRPAGGGTFAATDKARAHIEIVTETQRRGLLRLTEETLPTEQLIELRDLLKVIVEHIDTLTVPPKPGYNDSRKRKITEEMPLMEQIVRYLSMIDCFRGDCHMQSWLPYKVDGVTWETLTYLWMGNFHTADALEEELTYRRATAKEYLAALKKLVKLGWAEEVDNGVFYISENGRKVREEVEAQTERYFEPATRALSDAETVRLINLLKDAEDRLKMLRPA